MISLDLGCGKKKRAGFVGLDRALSSDADVVCDLREGLPFRDGVAERIVCDNLLEHIPDLVAAMNEIWRVCAHGAEVTIIAPYYTWEGAYQDPTHVRFFTEKTFLYFNRSLPYDYGFRGKFDIRSIALQPNPDFLREMKDVPWEIARKYFFNAVRNITAVLVADKEFGK